MRRALFSWKAAVFLPSRRPTAGSATANAWPCRNWLFHSGTCLPPMPLRSKISQAGAFSAASASRMPSMRSCWLNWSIRLFAFGVIEVSETLRTSDGALSGRVGRNPSSRPSGSLTARSCPVWRLSARARIFSAGSQSDFTTPTAPLAWVTERSSRSLWISRLRTPRFLLAMSAPSSSVRRRDPDGSGLPLVLLFLRWRQSNDPGQHRRHHQADGGVDLLRRAASGLANDQAVLAHECHRVAQVGLQLRGPVPGDPLAVEVVPHPHDGLAEQRAVARGGHVEQRAGDAVARRVRPVPGVEPVTEVAVPGVQHRVPVPAAILVVLRVRRVAPGGHHVEGVHRLAEPAVDLLARGQPGLAALTLRLLPDADGEAVAVGDPAADDRGGVVGLRAVEEQHDRLVRLDDRPADAQDVAAGALQVGADRLQQRVDGLLDVTQGEVGVLAGDDAVQVEAPHLGDVGVLLQDLLGGLSAGQPLRVAAQVLQQPAQVLHDDGARRRHHDLDAAFVAVLTDAITVLVDVGVVRQQVDTLGRLDAVVEHLLDAASERVVVVVAHA